MSSKAYIFNKTYIISENHKGLNYITGLNRNQKRYYVSICNKLRKDINILNNYKQSQQF